MYEAPTDRYDGIPRSFRFPRGLLGEGQVVLPDLVDKAGRVGQARTAFAANIWELATNEDACYQSEDERQDMQIGLAEDTIFG